MKFKKKSNKVLIHFVGIGGIGMSGIAELMVNLGYKVQGSDLQKNINTRRLKKKGIKIFNKHKSSNIEKTNAVVFSSAIKKNNPEILAAKKYSIPLVTRADMLAELMNNKHSIAVAGSHGKTTTTSLIGTILQNCNQDPTVVNGGIINSFSSNNRYGLGEWMVVEADESDGSFLRLPHEINIITNIDIEHLDFYKNFENLFKSFESFATKVPFYGYTIICLENKNNRKLIKKIDTRNVITYGINRNNSDLNIKKIKIDNLYSIFTLKINKKRFKKYKEEYIFKVKLLGEHNILNSVAAICVAFLLNLQINKIKKSLFNFRGVNRRFTYLGKMKNAKIYDDYAHHPTEINATIEITKLISKKRTIVIFQPHRFSRTKDLYSEFINILKKIDILWVCDIYSAGEKPIKNINAKKMICDLKKSGAKNVFYKTDKMRMIDILNPYFKEKNIIIFMGAGSISQWAYELMENKIDQ